MRKTLILSVIILTVAVISGCGIRSTLTIQKVSESNSHFEGVLYGKLYGGELKVFDVDQTGSEQYRVFYQAPTAFNPMRPLRYEAEQRAIEFCSRQGKGMKALSELATVPPYILGNDPRIEIIFICTDKQAAGGPLNQP